jgi:hypothetical protein
MCCLITNYHNTSYWVRHDAGTFSFDIGRPSLPMEGLLARHGAKSAAFLTAANPGSAIASDEANEEAQKRLRHDLEPLGPVFDGLGSGIDLAAEPSFLSLGIDRDEAERIGQRYGQNAIIWFEGSVPEVIWLRRDNAAAVQSG